MRKKSVRNSIHLKVSSLLLALICFCLGCANQSTSHDALADMLYGGITPPTRHEQLLKLKPQLQNMTIDDGIDSKKANIIAQSYFLRFGPGCGMAIEASDDGESWTAKTYIGYAGTETREPIRIDKRTGKVTWSNGPTIENPKMIFN
jgi:hypothetical protein